MKIIHCCSHYSWISLLFVFSPLHGPKRCPLQEEAKRSWYNNIFGFYCTRYIKINEFIPKEQKKRSWNKNRYSTHCVIIIFCIFIVFVHGWKFPKESKRRKKSVFRMREHRENCRICEWAVWDLAVNSNRRFDCSFDYQDDTRTHTHPVEKQTEKKKILMIRFRKQRFFSPLFNVYRSSVLTACNFLYEVKFLISPWRHEKERPK